MDREEAVAKSEDEISLVDLIAVVVRYRRMILAVVVIAVAAAVAGWIIYPGYEYGKRWEGARSTHEVSATVRLHPGAGQFVSARRFGSFFSYPGIMRLALMDTGRGGGEEEVSAWTPEAGTSTADERKYAGKNGRVEITENVRAEVFEIRYRAGTAEGALGFVEAYMARLNEAVERDVRPLAERYVEIYERGMEEEALVDFSGNNNPGTYIMAKAWLTDGSDAVIRVFEPYVVETTREEMLGRLRKKYLTAAAIGIFAAVFLGIFLSFTLNAIGNVRGDEEAMGKIRAALGSGGKRGSGGRA